MPNSMPPSLQSLLAQAKAILDQSRSLQKVAPDSDCGVEAIARIVSDLEVHMAAEGKLYEAGISAAQTAQGLMRQIRTADPGLNGARFSVGRDLDKLQKALAARFDFEAKRYTRAGNE